MAVDNPPAYLQGSAYSASRDRLHAISARFAPTTLNVLDPAARGGILPGQSGRQANYSMTNWDVTINRFIVIVENTFASQAGDYQVINLSPQVLAVTPSSPTTNRIDIIGVRVQDAFYSGALNQADIVVVQGTATAGTPADPALPASFLPIVRVTVNAATSTGILTNLRKRTGLLGGVYPPYTEQLTDNGTHVGEMQLLPAAGVYPARLRVWDGTVWRGVSNYTFAKPAQTGSGTLAPLTTGLTVMSLSVADPGYAYRLNCQGSLGWAVTAANVANLPCSLSVTLDSTTWNGTIQAYATQYSAAVAAAQAQATVVTGDGVTSDLTGAHTIRTIARNHSATANNFTIPLNPVDTNLAVKMTPA